MSGALRRTGVLVVEKFSMIQQRALTAQKAKNILGCIKRSTLLLKRSREGILTLCPAVVKSHVE